MKNGATTTLTLLMILSSITVLVVIWLAVDRIQNVSSPQPLAPSADSLEAVVIDLSEYDLVDKSDMLERPLFWQERRPYVAKEKKVVDKKPVLLEEGDDPFDKIKLIGVYSGGAIFIVDGEKKRLYIGDEVAEWTLDLMNADSVIFVQGSENKLLQLEHATVKAAKVKPAKAKTVINKASEQITAPPPTINEPQNKAEFRGGAQKPPPRMPLQDNELSAKEIENGALQPILDLN